MIELVLKQAEIIESLVWLLKKALLLLGQYTNIEVYEDELRKIVQGDDIEIN